MIHVFSGGDIKLHFDFEKFDNTLIKAKISLTAFRGNGKSVFNYDVTSFPVFI